MNYKGFALTLGLVLLVNGSVIAGTIYKWVDGNGVTHFSDVPKGDAEVVGAIATKKQAVQGASNYYADQELYPDYKPGDTIRLTQNNGEYVCLSERVDDDAMFSILRSKSDYIQELGRVERSKNILISQNSLLTKKIADVTALMTNRSQYDLNMAISESKEEIEMNKCKIEYFSLMMDKHQQEIDKR